MNSCCAFVLPSTNFPKSTSLSISVTSAFLPAGTSPDRTSPVSFKSMCHVFCAWEAFLSVKAKMEPAALMAAVRSESEEERAAEMVSKAVEEGKDAEGGLGVSGE